jgi:UDP-GlcNAc3NAcA epimerase
MKIITIVGARPQFIKANIVSKSLCEFPKVEELILHTGQHFDVKMSDVFFQELGIPQPAFHLNISGGTHGDMTGRMLIEIEKVLLENKPDRVLVYGDTNSTLAGALAASKLHIPVAHVEAGLRSFNKKMPEEINRILTDQMSDVLFCPTTTAVENLNREGFSKKVFKIHNVGDVMLDSALFFASKARKPLDLKSNNDFILATLHRAENTNDSERMKDIVQALNEIHQKIAPVVMPLHPRTREILKKYDLSPSIVLIDPVGYLEMLYLLKNCSLLLTDSGGVQKEAFFFKKPCLTLRDETEWIELVEAGVNILVGSQTEKIIQNAQRLFGTSIDEKLNFYGTGNASKKIATIISEEELG